MNRTKSMRSAAIALIAPFFTHNVASAESTSAALKAMGLIGTWSLDCAETYNFRTTWNISQFFGSPTVDVTRTFEDGTTLKLVSDILEATRVTDEKIKIVELV